MRNRQSLEDEIFAQMLGHLSASGDVVEVQANGLRYFYNPPARATVTPGGGVWVRGNPFTGIDYFPPPARIIATPTRPRA